ncbi:MAG: hypothetical protein PF480_06245, partial [Roseovarius sp.]|nr:hypothetical protein [Roseovarius sp.]
AGLDPAQCTGFDRVGAQADKANLLSQRHDQAILTQASTQWPMAFREKWERYRPLLLRIS